MIVCMRRVLIPAVIVLSATLSPLGNLSYAETRSQQEMVKLAVGAYQDGLYPLVQSQIHTFFKEFPESPQRLDLLYLLGRTYFLQGNFSKARETFLAFIDDDRLTTAERNYGLFWLAESCVQLDRWDEAKAYYLRFITGKPEGPFLEKALFALGLIAFRNGALAEAEDYLSRGVRKYPGGRYRSQEQYYRGLIYSQWGNYNQAVRLLREAIFSSQELPAPLRRDALYSLAENRLKLGQFQLALPYLLDFYSTHSRDPRAPLALYKVGYCQLKTDRRKEALESFRMLVKKFQNSEPYPYALSEIGEIYLEQRNYKKAKQVFSQILKEFPESELAASALVNLGWCLLNLGDFDGMTRIAHRLLRLPTERREKTLPQLLLAEVHFHKGEYKEALPYFFNLLNVPAQRENALYKISRCYFYEGKYKDAITNFEILALEYPDTEHLEECLFLRGKAASLLGDTEKAIASFTAILDKKGNGSWRVGALYELAKIYYERKDVREAEKLFSTIVCTVPKTPTAVLASYYLGIISFKEKRYADALPYLEDALQSKNPAIRAECHYRMGEIYLQRRSYTLSRHHFQRIIDTLADQKGWLELAIFEMGRVHLALGDSEKATRAFQEVLNVSKDPDLRMASEQMLGYIGRSKAKPS
ncbi:MAG: tetratricopeptide repeat protein [Deltaproteobacteria bacterium]|nr:tetratricopeptide repeat protein [Deltaproteobacteria bacterium]